MSEVGFEEKEWVVLRVAERINKRIKRFIF
jgi:hypothetical protein